MEPCYVVTYFAHGACAVDANAVDRYEDENVDGFNKCHLYFTDGSDLRLEESCEDFNAKRPACTSDYPDGIPVFPQ